MAIIFYVILRTHVQSGPLYDYFSYSIITYTFIT